MSKKKQTPPTECCEWHRGYECGEQSAKQYQWASMQDILLVMLQLSRIMPMYELRSALIKLKKAEEEKHSALDPLY